MKKLLVNGCSYARRWSTYQDLAKQLGYQESVNIALGGGSNDRTFRTTYEYLTQNSDVDFVILKLTFFDRVEAPWGQANLPYENRWVSYAANGITNQLVKQMNKSAAEEKLIDRYIADRFRVEFDIDYLEKLMLNLTTFAGWLDSIGINYCIFNTCDIGLKEYTKIPHWIKRNPRIIDLNEFMSNQYIFDNNGGTIPEGETHLDPRHVHYYDRDNGLVLNNFLYEYITKNCL